MRFLRIKSRRALAEAANVGARIEEEEEGRRSLLIPRTTSDPIGDVKPVKIELPDLNILRVAADSPCDAQQGQPVSPTQVISLKAFIHCQGCARRVKKTLSKLQGVRTFHVDMDQHKVTVIGSVSADEVLQNVDKVLKGAQLLHAPVSTDVIHRPSSPN